MPRPMRARTPATPASNPRGPSVRRVARTTSVQIRPTTNALSDLYLAQFAVSLPVCAISRPG
jgi:hypothetical protein